MNYVDLHVHSNASDGTLSPEEVIAQASLKRLKAIALTDHDTVAGIARAKKAAAASSLELVPGVELSCFYGQTEIHILGFYVDETDTTLTEGLEYFVSLRRQRNETMLQRFKEDGFAIAMEDLAGDNPDTVVTRAHFARALVEKGYASSMAKAFERYLQYGGRYCRRKETVTPEQAMELLCAAHAWPCLAHPMQYHLRFDQIETLVLKLKELGLRGIEAYHSSQTSLQSTRLKKIAKTYGLLPSGGSDFHGSNKPDIQLGTGRGSLHISYQVLENIKKDHLDKNTPKQKGGHDHENSFSPGCPGFSRFR